MKRIMIAGLLLGLFAYVNNQGLAQTGGKEAKIKFHPKGTDKTEDVTGVIQKESLEGIEVKTAKGVKVISAEEIVEVDYPAPNFESSQALRKAQKAEKDRKYEDAISQYGKVKATDKKFTQHVEYKVAVLTAKIADSDASQMQPAIDLLEKYLKNHPDSWQIISFPKLLVPLQLKAKDIEGAQKTLDTLAASKKIPDSLRQELSLMTAKILIEARKYDEAEKKLTELIKGTKDEGQMLRLRVSRAECMAANKKFPQAKTELQDIISKSSNPDVKAAALNTLGEVCRNNNETREAMWNFLYVDVLYNQNTSEHTRAIKNLAEVFADLKDAKRAKQYADMLKKEK